MDARTSTRLAIFVAASLAASAAVKAEDDAIERGKYLVTVAGCTDCHTPGHFLGKPDMARYLGGSDVGLEIPGLGVFYGPNLTPESETGTGKWSPAQLKTAIQTGVRPDGRQLAPAMPYPAYAKLKGEDADAIVTFLKSLAPVSNKVPGPFGPNDKPTSFVMKVVAP